MAALALALLRSSPSALHRQNPITTTIAQLHFALHSSLCTRTAARRSASASSSSSGVVGGAPVAREPDFDKKAFRHNLTGSDNCNHRGFGHKEETLQEYTGNVIKALKENDNEYTWGNVTVKLPEAYGFCLGVERAVQVAYEARKQFPKERIWITNEIIHNPRVNKGNNLLMGRSLIGIHNMITKPDIVGNTSFRFMSTKIQPEVSSEHGSFVASSNAKVPPRIKFKRLDKTAKHIMNILDKESVDKVRDERHIPDIKPGYIVQLKVEVPENKRRVSAIKGIVIARRNAGLNTTFRLRRMVAGVGVESVFPLYSPNLKEMKVLDKKKVRRAKLYYLRDRMNALKK